MSIPNFNVALRNYLLKRSKFIDNKIEVAPILQQQQHRQIESPFTPEISCEGLNNILKDVVAYVEVRGTCEDRSDAIAHHLLLLGATISKYFNRKVTHVFFRNGRLSTYKKAVQWGIPMVSVLWIEECKHQRKIVPEKDFAADIPEEYTCPYFSGKIKRFKSMEPKSAEFDVNKSLENKFKRQQRQRIRKECLEFLKLSPESKRKNIDNFCGIGKEIHCTSTPILDDDDGKLSNKTPVTTRKSRKRKLFSPGKDELLNFSADETITSDESFKPTSNCGQSINFDSSQSSFDSFTNKENATAMKNKKTVKFENKTRFLPRRSLNCSRRASALVLSSIHNHELEAINAVIAQLGRFRVVFNVDETTSHVVCGAPRRTLNVLYALARGCWVLSSDWIFRSLEAGDWLPEEEFTLKETFPILFNRFEATSVDSSCGNLFRNAGLIFVSDNVILPKKKLIDLIRLCGGRITSAKLSASILIGVNIQCQDKAHLSQDWVLDCISQGKLLPIDNYSSF